MKRASGRRTNGMLWPLLLLFRSARKNVSSTGLCLDLRIRISFGNLFDFESGDAKRIGHCLATKKIEIERHFRTPQLVEMHNLISPMKCEQEQTGWSKHSPHFKKNFFVIDSRNQSPTALNELRR